MSLFGLIGKIDNTPEQQLRQKVMAKEPDSYLALIKLMDMQKMKQGSVPPQMQQQAQQPSVAQQAVQSPQPQGLPALPTGRAIPQQYAEGGVVGFGRGGQPKDVTQGTVLDREPLVIDPYEAMYGVPLDTPQGMPPGFGLTYGTGIGRDIRNMYSGSVGQEIDREQAARYRAAGRTAEAEALEKRLAPAGIAASIPVRAYHDPVYNPPPPSAPAPGSRQAGSESGLASLRVRGGAGTGAFPAYKSPWDGAPAHQTEEQRDATIRAKYDALKAQYGPDVADDYLKQIQQEREGLKRRYEDNRNEAIMRAGLGMLAGRSKYGAINIGEGGKQGLDAYQAGRASLDTQGRELRRQEMEAAIAKQGRERDIYKEARIEGNAATERKDRDRAEAVEMKKYEQTYGIKAAEFAQVDRKINVMAMQAQAEIARGTLTKMDAAARIYQSAQADAMKVVEDAAAKDPRSDYARMTAEQRAQAAQTIAERMIKNNPALKAIMEREGASPARHKWPG